MLEAYFLVIVGTALILGALDVRRSRLIERRLSALERHVGFTDPRRPAPRSPALDLVREFRAAEEVGRGQLVGMVSGRPDTELKDLAEDVRHIDPFGLPQRTGEEPI